MLDDRTKNDLLVLFSEYTEGRLSEAQEKELAELLRCSSEARSLYVKHRSLEAKLRRRFGRFERPASGPPLTVMTDIVSTSLPGPESAAPIEPIDLICDTMCDLSQLDFAALGEIATTTGLKGSRESDSGSPILGFIGGVFKGDFSVVWLNVAFLIVMPLILAVVTVICVSPTFRESSQDNKWVIAARVRRAINCEWKKGCQEFESGDFLIADQSLSLRCGLVELEFSSGAKVILQGPAEFVVSGTNLSGLSRGQLVAVVPEEAEGFTVQTPGMDVIDLGTEFGVSVDEGGGKTRVHVFKGTVEMKVARQSKQRKRSATSRNSNFSKPLHLKENEAAQYDEALDDIVPIPVDKNNFVHSLDHLVGVVANLNVINPSFELPAIKAVPGQQPEQGNTLFNHIHGWKMSDLSQSTSRVAMCQISPYKSSDRSSNVGPGATDGRQVAAISLGVKPGVAGKSRSNWIYQSLGTVATADVGKILKLSVDAGPRNGHGGSPQGSGIVSAKFALHVTPQQIGEMLGSPSSFRQSGEIKQLHRLEASVRITNEIVGQELFVLLAASDDGSSRGVQQYHFDNVEVFIQN